MPEGPRTIDRFVPAPDVRERFETVARAPADVALEAARDLDLESIALVRAIFWLRARLTGSRAVRERGLHRLVPDAVAMGWGVLAERPGREIVMGGYTRPWEPDPAFHALAPDRFAAFAEPGVVKIVWTLEAEPLSPATSRIATETRAAATDDAARRRFRSYWRRAAPGILLVRWLALPAVRRAAERRAAARRPGFG